VFRQRQPEHAVLVFRLDVVGVDQRGKRHDADELAERPFLANPSRTGHLGGRTLALHGQLVPFGHGHFQICRIDAGKIGLGEHGVLVFPHVEQRQGLTRLVHSPDELGQIVLDLMELVPQRPEGQPTGQCHGNLLAM